MTKQQPTTVETVVYQMLLERTGTHCLDSGGAYGRHWQRNQGKTIHDFRNEPAVEFDLMGYKEIEGQWKHARVENTAEIGYTISVFHYLTNGALALGPIGEEFNARPVNDWDFEEACGVSKRSGEWLLSIGADFGTSFNTYNHESFLSQVLQGTHVTLVDLHYVLLQLHGGCDVRGGYTDAKLFALSAAYMPPEEVIGVVIKPDTRDRVTKPIFGEPPAPARKWISNGYDGYSLTDEDGRGVEIGPEDQVELWLPEY